MVNLETEKNADLYCLSIMLCQIFTIHTETNLTHYNGHKALKKITKCQAGVLCLASRAPIGPLVVDWTIILAGHKSS